MLITEETGSTALARVDALHTGLTQIVLEGGDLAGIAGEVARALESGVLFTSTDGRERAAALGDDLRARLMQADLVDPTGRFRVERVDASGVPVGAGQVRILRVAAGGTDLARLVCVRADGTFSAEAVQAMERASAVAALLMTREQAVAAVENKYQGDFLRDLFLRRAGDEQYVVEHASAFEWRLDRPVVVVSAELDPDPSGEPVSSAQRRQWQERFSAAWRQVSRDLGDGIPSVDFSSEVVTLLPVAEAPTDAGLESVAGHRGDRTAYDVVAGDKGGGRRSFSVGVSRWMPDGNELGAFTEDVLGSLAGDTTEAADLRETLRVLLDTNFNVAEAARLQFFHYNTMRYRVSKLERLLGPVASDPHLRLDVAVALRVLEITG